MKDMAASEATVWEAADDPVVGERVKVREVREEKPGTYECAGEGWYWGTVLEVRRYFGWHQNKASQTVESIGGDFIVQCAPGARHVCERRQLQRANS
jgi:hypothetical protein